MRPTYNRVTRQALDKRIRVRQFESDSLRTLVNVPNFLSERMEALNNA